MMKVYDIKAMRSFPYEERDRNVFFKSKEFKARIIELSAGEEMPNCEMASFVVFYYMLPNNTYVQCMPKN